MRPRQRQSIESEILDVESYESYIFFLDVRPVYTILCVTRSFLIAVLLSSLAAAQSYPPNGPAIPAVALNEGKTGAPPENVPPPNPWDQQSQWNMELIGSSDLQGR